MKGHSPKRYARGGGRSSHVISISAMGHRSGGRPNGNGGIRAAGRSNGSALPVTAPQRRPAVRKSLKAAAKARARRAVRRMPTEKVIKESQRWLNIIAKPEKLTQKQRKRIVRDTVKSFDTYFNSGFLTYRKSVTEAGQSASVEWTGQGTTIEDVLGNKYIDCLGGFGIYCAGIRHPKIVEAVRSQPGAHAPTADPLRRTRQPNGSPYPGSSGLSAQLSRRDWRLKFC